jgi:predicted nucleic acid-binding protein
VSEFVDANIFIRVLARDDPVKSPRSLALLERARHGQVQLVTSESVVAEVVYVLSSPHIYRLTRTEIVRLLGPVLRIRSLRLEHKRSVLRALDRYGATNMDFEDCLTVEHVIRGRLAGLYSYDRDFDRVASIRRLEP